MKHQLLTRHGCVRRHDGRRLEAAQAALVAVPNCSTVVCAHSGTSVVSWVLGLANPFVFQSSHLGMPGILQVLVLAMCDAQTQQKSKLRCEFQADHVLHWRVLQNLMKMVETKECGEADQPEVRSARSSFGTLWVLGQCLLLCLLQLLACCPMDVGCASHDAYGEYW